MLEFYENPNIKSETIKIIKDILLRFQLSLQIRREQCFDGVSNMQGKSSGVGSHIYKELLKAHHTHYHCHSLSLSIKDVTRSSKILSNVIDTATEFSLKLFENLKEQIKNNEQIIPNNITKLSTT